MSNHFDNYQIHYTSIIFVHSFKHHQPQYLLVAPIALLRTVVEAILQNILFSIRPIEIVGFYFIIGSTRDRIKRGKVYTDRFGKVS
jgi:hypothetical protein